MSLASPRARLAAAAAAAVVLLLVVIVLATRGGGGGTGGGPPPASEGIASRSPVPIAGLASPVPTSGTCIASYTLETIGRDSQGRPQPLLTLTLRSDPADESALAALLAGADCSAERRRLLATVSTALPSPGLGVLLVDYRTASGARLRLP